MGGFFLYSAGWEKSYVVDLKKFRGEIKCLGYFLSC